MDERMKLVQAAGIAERMSRLNQELAQANQRAADTLERTASAAPAILQKTAQHALNRFTDDIAKSVGNGLNQPMDDFHRHVSDSANRITGITHGMAQSQERMAAVVGKLRWLTSSVIAAMLLVILAGGGLLWHYHGVIADNQVEANLMRAYNQADVRLCDRRLCVRVDQVDKRYGEYVPVKPRPE